MADEKENQENQEKQKRTAEVLDKVKKIAAMAECPLHDEESPGDLFVNVGISDERSQVVYISYTGQTPDGKDVITFFSPCRTIDRGFLKGLGKKEATELLRMNSKMILASFALYDTGDGDALMVISDQLVDTMDVEEFESRLLSVAHIADSYEAATSGGGDRF